MSVAWISDALHEILGLSDATTETYIVSLAKASKSEKELLDKLILDNEFPATQPTRSFASKLFDRLGPKKSVEPAMPEYKKHELEQIAKRKKNESFQLIAENDIESDSSSSSNEIDAKTLKFMKDLEDIKSKKEH